LSQPGGTDLIETSQTIDCRHQIHGIFKIDGKWRSTTGKVHVSKMPLQLIWHANHTIFSFDTPPIFYDRESNAPISYNFLQHYIYKTQEHEQKLQELMDYTSKMSIDPDALYQLVVRDARMGSVVYCRAP